MIPAIRTADHGEIYLAYLQTPEWRKRRNGALHRARWRCERCGRAHRRDVPLEVHHRTYERLGREWNEDLEVLCVDCHRGETMASPEEGFRLALKLARAVLNAEPYASVADLSEGVKEACASHRVALNPHTIQKAVGLVTASRLGQQEVIARLEEAHQLGTDAGPIGASEARQILERLGVNFARSMPPVEGEW